MTAVLVGLNVVVLTVYGDAVQLQRDHRLSRELPGALQFNDVPLNVIPRRDGDVPFDRERRIQGRTEGLSLLVGFGINWVH
ncbi:MAG: hypothetical protein DMG86_16050 [Acidobacteria bacterium]|nr:MAG: hypothetical protein DMG86_16050 [Acidobacteriota bacterium]